MNCVRCGAKTVSISGICTECVNIYKNDAKTGGLNIEVNQPKDILHGILTKRELFAAMAMQGMVAHGRIKEKVIAKDAVAYADALIKELEEEISL